MLDAILDISKLKVEDCFADLEGPSHRRTFTYEILLKPTLSLKRVNIFVQFSYEQRRA
jgi:hypothetical protein